MKTRLVSLSILLLLIFLFLSCSKEQSKKTYAEKNDVTSVIESLAAEKNDNSSKVQIDDPTVTVASSNIGKVDVDLTTMSASVVYSAVYDMISNPSSYKGKVIRMNGPLAMYQDPSSGKRYFACIIMDATACCSQGIEFELNSRYSYPEDYPDLGTEITVTGTFDTYKEGEFQYCTLRGLMMTLL